MGIIEYLHSITTPRVLSSLDIEGVAKYLNSSKCQRIVIMAGAGISVSAGIPDFRSLTTGVYANAKKYNLPTPQHMFDLPYFLSDQEPFYSFFANDLYPSPTTKPTRTHHFIKLLCDKELLTRMYTQNIDSLERLAGVPGHKVFEVHGSLATASCARCKRACDAQKMAKKIREKKGRPECNKCGGPQKPDIVFFGENLPAGVREQMKLNLPDMRKCDLLIIMGTSLAVQPFASFIDRVPRSTPRVFINKTAAGSGRRGEYDDSGGQHMWGQFGNYRDVLLEGECDRVVNKLCAKLGWTRELNEAVERFETECRSNGGVVDAERKIFGAGGSLKGARNVTLENVRSASERDLGRRANSPKNARKMSKSASHNSLLAQGAVVYP